MTKLKEAILKRKCRCGVCRMLKKVARTKPRKSPWMKDFVINSDPAGMKDCYAIRKSNAAEKPLTLIKTNRYLAANKKFWGGNGGNNE